jgi:acetyl esterase/lipase
MKNNINLEESKNNTNIKKKPFYKKVWFIIVCVIIAIIGLTALTMPFMYYVQAVILKVACEPRNISEPVGYEQILESTEIVEDISYSSQYTNGYLDIISPKDNIEELPLLVYFHGGYYVAGDKSGSEPYCRDVAKEGYIVANVNYELAYEAQYPTQLIQANEAISYLVEMAEQYNIDTDNIFIGGDSAGGHLAGQLGAYYSNSQFQSKLEITPSITNDQLKGVVLLCGFYNASTVRQSNFPFLADAMWMYTGVKDFEEYERIDELNTVDNVTEDYPNTFMTCGSDDPFYEQNLEMKAKLLEKGINVTDYLPISDDYNLDHEFQKDFELDEAYYAMDLLINFLNTYSNAD